MLVSLRLGRSFHMVVLSAPEQEEGARPLRAWICQAGEPGVVGFDGSGESGVCVYALSWPEGSGAERYCACGVDLK